MKNYYHILGLSFEANPIPEVIAATYKALVKIYHPDVFKGDKFYAEQRIKEINEAYDVLGNSSKKKEYDKKLKDELKNKEKNEEDFKYHDDEFKVDKFKKDWEIALKVYPEIDKYKEYIKKFGLYLAAQYQVTLIQGQFFARAQQIKDDLISSFIKRKFGHSKEINELAIFLFENSEVKMAKELNQLIRVVGSDSSTKIIHSFVEDNINLTKKYKGFFTYYRGESNKKYYVFSKKQGERNKEYERRQEEFYNRKDDNRNDDKQKQPLVASKQGGKLLGIALVLFFIGWFSVQNSKNVPQTIEYQDGKKYVGQTKDGLPHGKGKFFYTDGSFFTGRFKDGLKQGHGVHKGKGLEECIIEKGFYKNDRLDNRRPFETNTCW